jgi:hypothetical protein
VFRRFGVAEISAGGTCAANLAGHGCPLADEIPAIERKNSWRAACFVFG